MRVVYECLHVLLEQYAAEKTLHELHGLLEETGAVWVVTLADPTGVSASWRSTIERAVRDLHDSVLPVSAFRPYRLSTLVQHQLVVRIEVLPPFEGKVLLW